MKRSDLLLIAVTLVVLAIVSWSAGCGGTGKKAVIEGDDASTEQRVSQDAAVVEGVPFYFVAIHNEPYHRPGGEEEIAAAYPVLQQIVDRANQYNIKLTLMFAAQWADYISASPERMADVESWKSQGHEIAGHHHSIYHGSWDGYTDFSEEEAIQERMKQGKQPEEYLGTLDDFIARLEKINPEISSGCMNDETDKKALPDQVIYDTCCGFANHGQVGKREGDNVPAKGNNEFILTGTYDGIERKWLAHYQVYQQVDAARSVFEKMESGVFGGVVHSVPEQADKLYDFFEFIGTKDPEGQNSKTLSDVCATGLLNEKQLSKEMVDEVYRQQRPDRKVPGKTR